MLVMRNLGLNFSLMSLIFVVCFDLLLPVG